MKITFDLNQTQNAQNNTSSKSIAERQTTSSATGIFNVQITGKTGEGEAYIEQGKTMSETLAQSGMDGENLQKKYMAVMSNSMSADDFNEMLEKGYDPTDIDVETAVTVLDSIKIAMTKGGTDIAGFTDTVSDKALKEAVGDTGFAMALKQKMNPESSKDQVQEINIENDIKEMKSSKIEVGKEAEEAIQQGLSLQMLTTSEMIYMLDNQMKPTIGNLYKAQFSGAESGYNQGNAYYAEGTTGYYSKKATETDMNKIAGQVDQIIANAGVDVTEESRESASFLLENGLPLTADTYTACVDLQKLQLPLSSQELQEKIKDAMESGKKPIDTDLSQEGTVYEKAVSILEETLAISEEALDQTVLENKTLNLRNLKVNQKKIEAAAKDVNFNIIARKTTEEQSASLVVARRQLAEVQLSMTAEANLKLLKSDYQLETASLENLISDLKEAEKSWQSSDVSQAENIASTITEMGELPAALLGQIGTGKIEFTVQAFVENGTSMQLQYEKAEQSYETLMTKPRSDLGDSIKTAFQNTDAILEDMNLSTTALNERAVRILGYNQMEITEENILKVIAADTAVQNIIEKVTPGTALQMIRDGINPLTTEMDALDQYLNQQEKEFTNEIQKYSKFLYQMEQNKEITEQEKEAYIGIYRLFRQIEKTDGAAVGYLVNTGAEINLGNLLSAVRSNKHKNMDYTIDDSFGTMDFSETESSISDQINKINQMTYVNQIWNNINIENLLQVPSDTNTTLEEISAHFVNNQRAEEHSEAEENVELEERTEQFRNALADSSNDMIIFLEDNVQQVTVSNLIAASEMFQNQVSIFQKIYQKLESHESKMEEPKDEVETWDQTSFDETILDLQNSLTDFSTAQTGFEAFQQQMTNVLQNMEDAETTTVLELRELQSAYKQISFSTKLAKQEYYEIPVKIKDSYTTINLKIVHDSQKSEVAVSMSLDDYGGIGAEFEIQTDGSVVSIMTAETDQGLQYLNQLSSNIQTYLMQNRFEVEEVSIVKVNKFKTQDRTRLALNDKAKASTDTGMDTKVSSVKLYQLAKAFIETIRN